MQLPTTQYEAKPVATPAGSEILPTWQIIDFQAVIRIRNEKAISYLYKISLSSVASGMQPKFINKRIAPRDTDSLNWLLWTVKNIMRYNPDTKSPPLKDLI